jgi:hypothetical protein
MLTAVCYVLGEHTVGGGEGRALDFERLRRRAACRLEVDDERSLAHCVNGR